MTGSIPTLIKRASWESTLRMVRLIPHYEALPGIRLTEIPLSAIESTARFVRSIRVDFACAVLSQMLKTGIQPFCPVIIRFSEGYRIVVPPVVEEHDDRFFLLDGTHRIWAARQSGLSHVRVTHISGLELPLPSKPFPWEEMRIREHHYTTEENLIDLDRSLFRPTTTTFNGPKTLVDEGED